MRRAGIDSALSSSAVQRGASRRGRPSRFLLRPSQSAFAGVTVELTRDLLRLGAAAQLVIALLAQNRLAVQRILEPFELCLEMLHPRFKRFDPGLGAGTGDC
jgi:hypothetical protein